MALKDYLRNLGSGVLDRVREAYPNVKTIAAEGARIIKESTLETIDEMKAEHAEREANDKAYQDFCKMIATGPERFRARMDKLALEGRRPYPADNTRIGNSGAAIVIEEAVSPNERTGYIVDPINGKVKRYSMTLNSRDTSGYRNNGNNGAIDTEILNEQEVSAD